MRVKHGHIFLEVHELQSGSGLPLLLLHELRGSSADWSRAWKWPGPVYALDFCGHGGSGWVGGGSYYPELLVGDADAVLAHLGSAALAGAGLGAYVALMLAGARARLVPGALLLPGVGLEGGGPMPDYEAAFPRVDVMAAEPADGFDPFVAMLDYFVRPPEYARELGSAARRILLVEDGAERPLWWSALRACGNVEVVSADLGAALERLAVARAA
jgi:pimeloyl-ACP methyl ester carboxylesterase